MPTAFPGYVSDVIALTERITADWGNAIRDRAPQVFATAALRDAAITAPQVGQTCILTTLGSAGLLVYSGATVGWTKPWNDSWGFITNASMSADRTGISAEADVTGLAVTWTALANRIYSVRLRTGLIQQVTSNGQAAVYISKADNSHVTGGSDAFVMTSGGVWTAHPFTEETGIAAGSVTRHIRATTSAGTLSVLGATGGASIISVYDIGPNGAPS